LVKLVVQQWTPLRQPEAAENPTAMIIAAALIEGIVWRLIG
jgi:hypothetical protein